MKLKLFSVSITHLDLHRSDPTVAEKEHNNVSNKLAVTAWKSLRIRIKIFPLFVSTTLQWSLSQMSGQPSQGKSLGEWRVKCFEIFSAVEGSEKTKGRKLDLLNSKFKISKRFKSLKTSWKSCVSVLQQLLHPAAVSPLKGSRWHVYVCVCVCQTVFVTLSICFRKPSGLLRDEDKCVRELECVKVRVIGGVTENKKGV